jgi:hypothetical protein
MSNQAAIIIGAIILSVGIALSNGIYEFKTINIGSGHKFNKFTGTSYVCSAGKGDDTLCKITTN